MLPLKDTPQLLSFSLQMVDLVKDFVTANFDFLLGRWSSDFFDYLLWKVLQPLANSVNLFAHFINFMLRFLEVHYYVEDAYFHDLLFSHWINFAFFLLSFLSQKTKTFAGLYYKRSHHIKTVQLILQHRSGNSSCF